jgi:lipoprotein
MKELFSIRGREITYRIIIVCLALVTTTISCFSLYRANKTIEKSKEEIYILLGDKSIVAARSSNLYNSVDVLCKGQVEDMNKLVFEQVPDDEEINRRLRRAIYLSDKESRNVIDMQQQNQFYSNIINQNFYTIMITDSIAINYSKEPFLFNYFGTLKFVRDKKEVNYKVETKGLLEMMDVATENNNRGILVKKFHINVFRREN